MARVRQIFALDPAIQRDIVTTTHARHYDSVAFEALLTMAELNRLVGLHGDQPLMSQPVQEFFINRYKRLAARSDIGYAKSSRINVLMRSLADQVRSNALQTQNSSPSLVLLLTGESQFSVSLEPVMDLDDHGLPKIEMTAEEDFELFKDLLARYKEEIVDCISYMPIFAVTQLLEFLSYFPCYKSEFLKKPAVMDAIDTCMKPGGGLKVEQQKLWCWLSGELKYKYLSSAPMAENLLDFTHVSSFTANRQVSDKIAFYDALAFCCYQDLSMCNSPKSSSPHFSKFIKEMEKLGALSAMHRPVPLATLTKFIYTVAYHVLRPDCEYNNNQLANLIDQNIKYSKLATAIGAVVVIIGLGLLAAATAGIALFGIGAALAAVTSFAGLVGAGVGAKIIRDEIYSPHRKVALAAYGLFQQPSPESREIVGDNNTSEHSAEREGLIRRCSYSTSSDS